MKLSSAKVQQEAAAIRSAAPIFVVGSARSGTTLLYHMLLSSGSFAHFRGEPAVFDLLVPKFGDLSIARNRERMMNSWIGSNMHRASGLDGRSIRSKVLNECRSNADFLRILMHEVALVQGAERWAVWGPDNLLYMSTIKAQMPDARFIHIIRDGRDVALSMHTEGFIRPFAWDKEKSLLVAGLHWQWKVRAGLQQAQAFTSDYFEVRFESLVSNPQTVLADISRFVGCELTYQRIKRDGVGTVKNTNSSFRLLNKDLAANPIGRWRRCLTSSQIASLESCIGDMLQSLGYELSSARSAKQLLWFTTLYPTFFSIKHWLKQHTKAGRFASIDRMRAADGLNSDSDP
jgi:hypothetical protein